MSLGVVVLVGCGGEDAAVSDAPVQVKDAIVVEQDVAQPVQDNGSAPDLPIKDGSVSQDLPQDAPVSQGSGSAVDAPIAPSPLTPETNPEPRVLSEQEKVDVEKSVAEAKTCTDGGGLYNSSLGECFTDAADEQAKTSTENEKLEILSSDDDETAARKECINAGNVYNAEQKACIEE